MSIWKTKEAAEEEIKVLQEYYGGEWQADGVDFWISVGPAFGQTILQIEAKLVRG